MRHLSALLIVPLIACSFAASANAEPTYAIAMHGKPALPANFAYLPYVNPDAPKGGTINYAWPGTFDSVNPFIVQGTAARGSVDLLYGDLVFDRLMMRSADEPFTMYPLLAKTIDTGDDRTWVEFTLDERAKFNDGQPVTPEDVIFTVELLRDKGLPRYGVTASKIDKMEKVGEHGVRFTFKQPDRELPLILANMPVLPKHAIDAATFDKSTLTPIVGSGPYTITSVKPGDSLTFTRNKDYWAKDLPSTRGLYNYDTVVLTYFRDPNALFESFKKGLVDVLVDEDSTRWTTQYNFPAVERGDVIKDTLPNGIPSGILGIVMNTRQPVFADVKVRRALTQLFDFEWANRNILGGAYRRIQSYYDNSDLSSHGRPASDTERSLLAPYPDAVTPEIMENGWSAPVSDGSGRDRTFLRNGVDKLKEAGYTLKNGVMSDANGKPLTFELMLKGDEQQQMAMAWQETLQKIGINMSIRSVDASQFLQRQNQYDFDAIVFNYTSSLSPGVEQVSRWGSQTKDIPGTFNFAGVANPAVDGMIAKMLTTRERSEFVETVRAYDRVLMSGAYVIPFYFRPDQWVAHWKRVQRPEKTPLNGVFFPAWYPGSTP